MGKAGLGAITCYLNIVPNILSKVNCHLPSNGAGSTGIILSHNLAKTGLPTGQYGTYSQDGKERERVYKYASDQSQAPFTLHTHTPQPPRCRPLCGPVTFDTRRAGFSLPGPA